MAFNNLAENAERLSRRIQESLQERTRDLTKSGAASYLDAPDLDKGTNLVKLLNSNSDRERLDGMKRIIAMISKNRNVSNYFAQVVKNVASSNLEIRKLVYIYLLRYASSEPDLALLSINTFQKDLADPNPLIRAMALRVLSGIPVVSIGSIILTAIRKCAADSNPYVRKAAALAIPKCYHLDSTHYTTLMQILATLLRDQSPVSIGSVVVAFNAVCPDRLELLHQHFRRLCQMIVDVDEWGQAALVDLLSRYARRMLARPHGTQSQTSASPSNSSEIDPDLELLFKSCAPLLYSRNAAVISAVTRSIYYLAPPRDHAQIIGPMLRLLHGSRATQRVALENICVVASEHPDLLRPHLSSFFIRASDTSQVKRAKLRVLITILDSDNASTLIREFKDYVVDTDDRLVSDAVWAIGRCAQRVPEMRDTALTALTMLTRSNNGAAVAASVLALKGLHQSSLASPERASKSALNVVARLAESFDDIPHAEARACIVWMVGQYSRRTPGSENQPMPSGLNDVEPWAPDVLRKAVKSFTSDAVEVKLQVLTLAAKLFVLAHQSDTIRELVHYVMSLARYDADYDLRDRGRFLSSLLIGVGGGLHDEDGEKEEIQEGVVLRTEQVKYILFEGKPTPTESDRWPTRYRTLGTLSLITDKPGPGDSTRELPEWADEGTDSSLRDTEDTYVTSPIKPMGFGNQSMGSRTGTPGLSTPVVLTPGGASPATSAPQGSFAAPKPQYMDLDEFFKSDEGEEEEEEAEEESDEEEANPHDEKATSSTSQIPPIAETRPQHSRESAVSEEYEEEEEEEEDDDDESDDEEEEDDAFLRRG